MLAALSLIAGCSSAVRVGSALLASAAARSDPTYLALPPLVVDAYELPLAGPGGRYFARGNPSASRVRAMSWPAVAVSTSLSISRMWPVSLM